MKGTMSESVTSGEGENKICRDFLRNVCRRGKRCKYHHPDEKEQEALRIHTFVYSFCHDFQNKQCSRPNCKFVHCTREEEEYYKATGELPPHVLESTLRKGITPDYPLSRGDIPVCKDYLKGECRRGVKCKFRHLTAADYELYNLRSRRSDRYDFERFECYDSYDGPEPKRFHASDNSTVYSARDSGSHLNNLTLSVSQQAEIRMLEDENTMLRKKIDELKKQVSDLTATNEFLLDQNAQLRLNKQTTNVTAVTVPAVTITNTVPAGASTVQVQPIAQISQPLSITARELTVVATGGQPTLNPQVPAPTPQVVGSVGTLRTVASVGTVPVSISAVTPTLAPTLASVSMAPVSLTQALPPPVVTMATMAQTLPQQQPQQAQAPPQPAAQPQSLPMSISGATPPLVSYPIMTQGMRPVLETSLSR